MELGLDNIHGDEATHELAVCILSTITQDSYKKEAFPLFLRALRIQEAALGADIVLFVEHVKELWVLLRVMNAARVDEKAKLSLIELSVHRLLPIPV